MYQVVYNFYQSDLRTKIQKNIYQAPSFDVFLFWKKYRGIIKEKKIGLFSLKWFQIMGIDFPLEDEKLVKKELAKLKSEYGKKWGNMFFQLCCINEIMIFDNYPPLSEDFVNDLIKIRKWVTTLMDGKYSLKPSIYENMPLANIFYDIDWEDIQDDELLLKKMNSNARRKIRKSLKMDFEFRAIKDEEIEIFWDLWTNVAGLKRFYTITKQQYLSLVKYLRDEKKWELFVSVLEGEILSGGIFLFDKSDKHSNVITYLYWFASRNPKNVGGQHYLMYALMKWWADHWYKKINTMWGAPVGAVDHALAWVSKLKESLWWYKIEHYGNFDFVLNKWLYKFYRWWKK